MRKLCAMLFTVAALLSLCACRANGGSTVTTTTTVNEAASPTDMPTSPTDSTESIGTTEVTEGTTIITNTTENQITTKKTTTTQTTKKRTTTTVTTTKGTVITTTVPTTTTTMPEEEEPERDIEFERNAVVATAKSFLARGNRIQYDDTRFSPGDAIPRVYRWQHSVNTPEEYTSQFYGYTNCAAFVHDVYFEALGFNMVYTTTASFIEAQSDMCPFRYYPTGEETETRKAELEQRYRNTLQPGDIIIVRYGGSRKGNGHAMLYVGQEALAGIAQSGYGIGTQDIIHSSGSSYSYSEMTERFEHNGSIRTMSVDDLFNPSKSIYVFDCVAFSIVRPLNVWQNGVPEKTVNRMNNLQGVIAEKLCSHTSGMTVNPGDEMTFTFSMENTNDTAVTLDVTDQVPANTTYVSGADTVKNNRLAWKVTVPAGATKTVSYTVRVNKNTPYGAYIHSEEGAVGGVDTDCPRVYVGKTLNAKQQKKIIDAAKALEDSELEGMALADAIYAKALGTTDLLSGTFEDVDKDVFVDYYGSYTHWMLTDSGYYSDMVAPTMYGGRYIAQLEARWDDQRTRLPYPQDLMVGDLIFVAENADASMRSLYLCLGDEVMELHAKYTRDAGSVTDNVLSYSRFAVLRPSMAMK